MMSRCLYCYQELGEGETDFHPQCGKKIFGSKTVPVFSSGMPLFLGIPLNPAFFPENR